MAVQLHEYPAGRGVLILISGDRGNRPVGIDRMASPGILLAVCIQSDQKPVRPIPHSEGQGGIQAGAVEKTVVIDQAAARKRKLLLKVPLADKQPGVDHRIAQGVIAIVQAKTLLIDRLAGVQRVRKAGGHVTVLMSLLAGEPTRVVGIGRIHGRQENGEGTILVRLPTGLCC